MSHDSPGYVAGRTRSSTLAAASTGQGQVFEPDFLLEEWTHGYHLFHGAKTVHRGPHKLLPRLKQTLMSSL